MLANESALARLHLSSSSSPSTPLPPAATLPNEICTSIFENLSQNALANVARVAQRWRAPAERLLYTSVVISEHLPRTSPMQIKGLPVSPSVPSNTLRCCETLSAHSHLADAVRRFHLRWHTNKVESPTFLLIIAQNIIRALIPKFIHLESLELALGLAAHQPHLVDLFVSCSLHHLRHVSFSGMSGSPEAMLRNHPTLLHLKLPDYIGQLHLTPSDVPHLTSFRGSPAVAASILPGRAVQALSLVGFEFVTEADLANMARTTTPVRSLDLSAMSVTPTLLRDISRHLAQIEVLRVKLALRHTLHFALSGIRLLAALTTVLGAFLSLQSLDLSPTNAVDGTGVSSASEEERLCLSWAGACPSLRRVIFPSKTEWTRGETGVWVPDQIR